MDWGILAIALIGAAICITLAEFVDLAGALVFGSQVIEWLKSGVWTSVTVGSHFDLARDIAPTGWVMVDTLARYIIFNVEGALLLVLAGVVGGLVRSWLDAPAIFRRRSIKVSSVRGATSEPKDEADQSQQRWWLLRENVQYGPYLVSDLFRMRDNERIARNDMIWLPPATEWRRADTFTGLFPKQATADNQTAP
jgi:hypothetical protein